MKCRRIGGICWCGASSPGWYPTPRIAGFSVLYNLAGYCRLGDGSDPPYQRAAEVMS